jgi:hypothetical protein
VTLFDERTWNVEIYIVNQSMIAFWYLSAGSSVAEA